MKLKSKKVIVPVAIIIAIFAIYQFFLKGNGTDLELAQVSYGSIVQEISETGQIQTGDKINLNFKSSGTIEKIYVAVGDEVSDGSALVKLDTSQLAIELSQARADLAIAQAELDKLLAGYSSEEIKAAETVLENAQQNLEDVKAQAQEDLNQDYQDALNTLGNSYTKGSSALTTVIDIRKTYFIYNDQESIIVKNKEELISQILGQMNVDISGGNIDYALEQAKTYLDDIYDAISVIREMTETAAYRDIVSKTNKGYLDTEKANINTALTNVVNAQQAIISQKLANESSINTAQGTVKQAEDSLAIKKAEPRQADIDLYQAKVNRAQAQVNLLGNKIWESTLRSPVKGKVAEINKRVGEMAQPSSAEPIVSLVPDNPYEIKVDIYEEDIVKMAVGNEVDIVLVALPDKIFPGKVVSINPAEKLVDGVVYYEVVVNFEESLAGVKPGMTADLVINTASRENVLLIPEDTILEIDGKTLVHVFKDGETEEREVKIGLEGSDGMVEVISGLAEGENIIIEP